MSWNPAIDPGCPDEVGIDAIETLIVPRARDLADIGAKRTPLYNNYCSSPELVRYGDHEDAWSPRAKPRITQKAAPVETGSRLFAMPRPHCAGISRRSAC